MAGWPIGATKQKKRKNHGNYRGSKQKKLLTLREKLPPPTGFMYIEAVGTYDAVTSTLTIRVSGRRTPANMGPGLNEVRTLPWNRIKNGDGSTPKALKAAMNDVITQIKTRTLPEVGMFIEGCCNSGQSPDDFLTEVCSLCSCWYCELSSSG